MVDGSRTAVHFLTCAFLPSLDVIVPVKVFPLIVPAYSSTILVPFASISTLNVTWRPISFAPDRAVFRPPKESTPLTCWYLCSMSSRYAFFRFPCSVHLQVPPAFAGITQ